MPPTTYAIYHDLLIKAEPAKVFHAVSRPEHLINWWPLTCTGNPETGATYNFYFGPEYNWYGKVSQVIPNQSFHIKMTQSDPDWYNTTFTFDIEKREHDVILHFSHINWPECNTHFKIASFCWAMLLKGLKDYVEQGVILPFEERS